MTHELQSTDSLWDALYTQRAIRRFKPDPVPHELIERIIEAGTKAPSGGNRQPWAFVVVEDKDSLAAIAEAMREHLKVNDQLRTYFVDGAQSDDRTERLMLSGALDFANDITSAPALIIPCMYPAWGDSLTSGSSIFPAVQNILLAARGIGLGTCLTTFNLGTEDTLREKLNLPADAMPVALIPIGYPKGKFGATTRKPVSEVLFWDKWGES